MRRSTSLIALPLALLAVSAVTATAADATTTSGVATRLTGAAEVPGPGDSNGTGLAKVLARPELSSVCVSITYQRVGVAMMAHIHEGSATVAGPVVVDFTPLFATSPPGSVRGCVATTPELAASIAADPSAYYVNVHTAAYPAGAIRGQLPSS